MDFFIDELVALTENLASFRMAKNHIVTTSIFKHYRRYFAGEGPGLCRVAVLCGKADRTLFDRIGNGRKDSEDRCDDDFAILDIVQPGDQIRGKLFASARFCSVSSFRQLQLFALFLQIIYRLKRQHPAGPCLREIRAMRHRRSRCVSSCPAGSTY